MENQKSSKKGLIIGVVVLAVLVVAALLIYKVLGPKISKGEKEIAIEVVNSNGDVFTYGIDTDAEYLRQAMDEAAVLGFTYSGSESEYGLYLETINGETADYTKDGAYWSIYVNDEYGMYGVDSQPVTDGDRYSFRYEVYDATAAEPAA